MTLKEPYEQGMESDPACICQHPRSKHHGLRGPCMVAPFGQCGCWEYKQGTWWRKALRKLGLA